MRKICLFLVSFSFLISTPMHAGNLWLPAIFSSNMVLQREMQTPVWGKAAPGSTVIVEIAGIKTQTTAGHDGKWMLRLPYMVSGGPFEMKVSAGEVISYKNVMLGDVWFASGQSNMEWTLNKCKNAEKEIAAAKYPDIRLFTIPKTKAVKPLSEVPGGPWLVCDPSTAKEFSGVAYFFGRKLFLDKNIPIGLIHSSWGGTPAEDWTSQEAVSVFPEYKKPIDEFNATGTTDAELADNIIKGDLRWKIASNSMAGLAQKVHTLAYDDKSWKTMTVPKTIDESEIGSFEGVIWFRKVIDIPKEMAGKSLMLKIGRVDHMDYTYVNGVEVGHSAWSVDQHRTYILPANLVKAGKNVIVVRDADLWSKGGLIGPADSMYISTNGIKNANAVSLAGDWKYNNTLEPAIPAIQNRNAPGLIFNAMVAPVIPYGIKGAIWYQGEANAWKAYQYRTLLPVMINDWRVRWGEGYFPFFMVQLANFAAPVKDPAESDWAELREAQLLTTNYPNVGMACAIDLGEAFDIHPTNKQDVGARLALAAEKIAYGDNVVYSGPLYKSMKTDGNTIRLKFVNIGSGLMIKGDKLTGFSIAGVDKKFVWADAKIEGDEIVVSASSVSQPVAVRYAWASNPSCNLYNKEGLPASPFRTDEWPGITVNNK